MADSTAHQDLSPRQQPLLFLTIAFVAGILADQWLAPPFWLGISVLSLSIGAGVAAHKLIRDNEAAAAILAGVIAAGMSLSAASRFGVRSDGLKGLMDDGQIAPTDPVRLIGVLDHPPEPVPDGVLLDVRAEKLEVATQVLRASGSARLMLPLRDQRARNEYEELRLDYGCRVRVLVRLEPAKSYSNPGAPDFNDFLESHGYQLKGTIKSPLLIQVSGSSPRLPLLGALYRARLWFMARIDKHFPERVAGTLKAMLAGNRFFVDPEA